MLLASIGLSPVLAHREGAFHTGDLRGMRYRTDWMASLPDHSPMTHLSLPGTHDTMTFKAIRNPTSTVYGSILAGTQSLTLEEQLTAGIPRESPITSTRTSPPPRSAR
jgi:hypothetical protein